MKLSVSAVSIGIFAGIGVVAALVAPAHAHFRLIAPAPATAQNNLGDPQKVPGCGGGALNNVVTPVKAGDSITVRWAETIYHPGHYRISLAKTQAEFQAPTVTGANCGQAAIMSPPAMPVLADGVNVKTTSTNLMFETSVKIPENFTCDKCFLQVVQFMSAHSEPCFYYHCAQLSVTAADSGPSDGGVRDAGARPDAVVRDGARGPDTRPPGTGGTAGAGGSGGSAGTGAAPAGGGRGGSGGAPPAAAPPSGGDEAGGFCSIGGGEQRPVFALALIALAGAFLWRTRRRR